MYLLILKLNLSQRHFNFLILIFIILNNIIQFLIWVFFLLFWRISFNQQLYISIFDGRCLHLERHIQSSVSQFPSLDICLQYLGVRVPVPKRTARDRSLIIQHKLFVFWGGLHLRAWAFIQCLLIYCIECHFVLLILCLARYLRVWLAHNVIDQWVSLGCLKVGVSF
jgi:hypothetical protein